jgi:hypothetical protein
MANVYEYFTVLTEGGRSYLIQANNAAAAAFNIENNFQERVTNVSLEKYFRIILIGDQHGNEPETTDGTTEGNTPEIESNTSDITEESLERR